MMNGRIKTIIKHHSTMLSRIYYFFMNNKVRGAKGNVFRYHNVFLRGLRLTFNGKGNEVTLGGVKPSALANLHIAVHGSHHKVIIEGGVGAKNLSVYCADEHCEVHVMEDTQISGKTELAVMEGTKIEVGKDCLFSANITLRAGDSHSVIDAATGERINHSKDIIVGDHVWIGNTVIVTKGTVIGEHSVVATGSVVAGKTFPANSAIGGNPAKVIKEGVSWLAQKI